MQDPQGDEMTTAISKQSPSIPVSDADEKQAFDSVRDAVNYAEVDGGTSHRQPHASDNDGGVGGAPVNPTKDLTVGGGASIQALDATTSSNIYPPDLISTESTESTSGHTLSEQHDMTGGVSMIPDINEQYQPPIYEQGAQLNAEDEDRPSMDTDQMSEATSVPSMELYVDSQGDADSALGDFSIMSSTQSLRPSVYDFVEENGRRFHGFRKGEYHLPNDETEQDRLDLQHHLMLLTLDGKLNLAPVENMEGGLHNVLDIATGTGIWAIEFASANPAASVLGSDLSPIQPDFVPPNCRFEIDDVEDEWLYSHKFDYIHGRALALCFRSHKVVFGHAFNALRPGGWFEVQDIALPMVALDDTVAGTAVELWVSRLLAGGEALGKDFSRVPTYKKIFEELGFVDIVEKHFQWPVGTWAKGQKMKVLGAWMREDMLAGIQGGSMGVMVKGLGMTVEEVERFLVDVREDLKGNSIHCYFPVHVVYGRRPL